MIGKAAYMNKKSKSYDLNNKYRDELFGLWKDYKEVENHSEYVRKLRNGKRNKKLHRKDH